MRLRPLHEAHFSTTLPSRVRRACVEVERTIANASPARRVEAATVAANAMERVASAIRTRHYQTAYELLDILATKMRGMRMH